MDSLRPLRALVIIVFALACVASARGYQVPPADESSIGGDLLRLVNAERSKRGLRSLKHNDELAQAARDHSQAMADARQLAHRVGGEPDLGARVAQTGLRFDALAENVSRSNEGGDAADNAHQSFMASPGHRANVLDARYNAIGIGVVRRGNFIYVTEDFAHMYDDMSPAQAEQAVLKTFQRERADLRLPPARSMQLDRLDRIACDPGVTPGQLLQRFQTSQTAVVFTIWNTDELPEPMLADARRRDLNAVAIRACPLAPSPGGNGGFRVVAVFF